MDIVPLRIPLAMPLVKNDEKLLQIEELIDSKRRMLLEKQKKIRFIAKQNRFLDAVKNDYVKYYTYIAQQKQDQIKALQLLDNYIRDLSKSGELSKNNIEDAKIEQAKILREVKSIKDGLESIMENTKHIDAQI
jgi:uncharacterized membrane-anchored protein YhcB (DUF1043 family)